MAEGEYDSVADRMKSARPRVHSDLPDTARERLAVVTVNPARKHLTDLYNGIPSTCIRKAVNKTLEDVGAKPVRSSYDSGAYAFQKHMKIIREASRNAVLAYIENLLEIVYQSSEMIWDDIHLPQKPISSDKMPYVREKLSDTVNKINIILETEGVLWKLEQTEMNFNFRPIGSEMMEQSDEEISVIAQGKQWESVISPYNSAYNLYLDRTYGKEIPEKLYNSIEELARTICVDLEGWTDNREQNLSVYLELMRENGLFEPNNIMKSELEDLSKSMERTFQKAGAERKNRHSEIDREYATLLLHQVSAHLTFLIRQYESKYGEGD